MSRARRSRGCHASRCPDGAPDSGIIGLGDIGSQPYFGDDRSNVLVFNGEIYNYRRLGHEIEIKYRVRHPGMYALLRSRDFGQIDRMRDVCRRVGTRSGASTLEIAGIKPLYVRTHNDGQLSFASIPSAIPLTSGKQGTAKSIGITEFLASGYFREGESAFEGIEESRNAARST